MLLHCCNALLSLLCILVGVQHKSRLYCTVQYLLLLVLTAGCSCSTFHSCLAFTLHQCNCLCFRLSLQSLVTVHARGIEVIFAFNPLVLFMQPFLMTEILGSLVKECEQMMQFVFPAYSAGEPPERL